MMKLRVTIAAVLASLALFGYKFGNLQWATCPSWSGAAYWPEQIGDPLNAGSLKAIALLFDGAQERVNAGVDFDVDYRDFTPDVDFGLPTHINYQAALSKAESVFYTDIWASTYCPDFPTFAFCSCTNINLHNPGNLHKLGCLAPNLDCSGVIYNNSWDGAIETNFVIDVGNSFGFKINPSRNPFGTTGMNIVRTDHPNAMRGNGHENTLSVSSVQNALALLPYFDRTYDLIEMTGDYYQYEYRPFKKVDVSYDCMRIFNASGDFDPAANTSLSIGDYYDEYEDITTNTTYHGKAVFAYSDSETIVSCYYSAMVYSWCFVGRDEHMSDEEWENVNPTVEDASKWPLVFDRSPTDDGGFIELHRGDFGGTNTWDGGTFEIHIELLHSSRSSKSSANDTGFYFENLYGHDIPDFWKGRISGQKLFVRSSAKRDDFLNGERQSITNEFHSIAEGEKLDEMFDMLCDYARANSVDKSCETSTRTSIEASIKADGITGEPRKYAAVYKITSEDLNNEPDKKVYPCGIVFEDGAYYEDTDFTQAGVADLEINLTDRNESDNTTAEPKVILRQIDWNFKSLVK